MTLTHPAVVAGRSMEGAEMSANEAESHLTLEQQPFGDDVREAMRRWTDKWWWFVAVGVAWLIVSASSVVGRPEQPIWR
jgi:hypothetical protein